MPHRNPPEQPKNSSGQQQDDVPPAKDQESESAETGEVPSGAALPTDVCGKRVFLSEEQIRAEGSVYDTIHKAPDPETWVKLITGMEGVHVTGLGSMCRILLQDRRVMYIGSTLRWAQDRVREVFGYPKGFLYHEYAECVHKSQLAPIPFPGQEASLVAIKTRHTEGVDGIGHNEGAYGFILDKCLDRLSQGPQSLIIHFKNGATMRTLMCEKTVYEQISRAHHFRLCLNERGKLR